MTKYFLMNKNEKILEFETSESLGGTKVIETQSFTYKRPLGFTDIATWIEQRNYAKHKDHFKKWLKEWGLDTIDGFLIATHALGINDSLWVKPIDSDLTWEKVNLYENEFNDVAAKTAFESGLYGLQISTTSPEFTSEGTFPKCWKKTSDGILLYKAGLTGAANVGLEPYSEYMASQISSKLTEILGNGRNTEYDLLKYKNKICSSCALFTNQDIGFAPAYKFIDRNRVYTLSDILDLCTKMGYEKECREMILIDSIIFNQDRHLGNFGFLFDNNTFKIIGFAPLFDFNISMLCNAMEEDLRDYKQYEEKYQVGHKLGGIFSEVGQQILTSDMKNKLPKELNIPMHKIYNLPNERLKKISDIFHSNYDLIRGKEKSFYIDSQKKSEKKIEEYDDI